MYNLFRCFSLYFAIRISKFQNMNSQDFEYLSSNLDTEKLFGSDTAIANLFLLQQKYNTELKIHKNILFRYYTVQKTAQATAFPSQ